jgi:hypothetical protein
VALLEGAVHIFAGLRGPLANLCGRNIEFRASIRVFEQIYGVFRWRGLHENACSYGGEALQKSVMTEMSKKSIEYKSHL